MITAVDSSVIIDILTDDPKYADAAIGAVGKARQQGSLVVCESVVAEIVPALHTKDVGLFFEEWGLTFSPATLESAQLAGEMFRLYLRRGGREGRVVADFLIGAHAQLHADRLLTRDRGFYRDYFKRLTVWDLGQAQ